MLAMLRWTKMSPGPRPVSVVSGTRESEQPSQRMDGCWEVEREGKRSGLWWQVSSAQWALVERRWEMMGSLFWSSDEGEVWSALALQR